MKSGFTLAELLIVIAVLSTAGLLVLSVFTSSLRGSNKAQILSSIKKNGQSALDSMDKTIRNADNLVCPTLLFPVFTLVIVKDGIYTRYRFIAQTSLVNGQIQQDIPVKQNVKDSNPPREETDSELADRVCPDLSFMLPPNVLTDTDPKSGVSVEEGSFTTNSSPGFKNQVKIQFKLKPGVGAPEGIRGQIDPVSFETTVSLR